MKKVLITGGAGFLGRGVLRRAARGDVPWDVTVYSRDETKQEICSRHYPQARYILGDVRDLERLAATMAGHDLVIHAAAMKYIPEAEMNAQECVSVNVGGADNIIVAARRAGVERVVGISTDKAVQPVNIYGATKMAMERMFAEASQPGGPLFTCVRYGNVIGSTGSVIPLFRRQAQELGRVQLTNPKMTRFWMSVDEAIDLIGVAASLPSPGAVFIPLVRSMSIADVVLAAVGEVPVDIIGMRPGEKVHEKLVHYEESVRVERFNDHFELYPPGHNAGTEPFTLASHTPHYWMQPDEMREHIADAEEI